VLLDGPFPSTFPPQISQFLPYQISLAFPSAVTFTSTLPLQPFRPESALLLLYHGSKACSKVSKDLFLRGSASPLLLPPFIFFKPRVLPLKPSRPPGLIFFLPFSLICPFGICFLVAFSGDLYNFKSFPLPPRFSSFLPVSKGLPRSPWSLRGKN